MIALILSILSLVVSVSIIVFISKLAKVLDSKFESLQQAFNEQIKILDEQLKTLYGRVDKNDERIGTIVKWCETLRENQDTLQTDLQKLYYGVKREGKKIQNLEKREQPKAQEPV